MQRSILVVTPDSDLGQQIRSHLEEGGRYQVTFSTNGQEALNFCSVTFFDVAILDAGISDVLFVPFTRDLIALQPDLKILVFPIENNPHHPALSGLVANGFLTKPFFGPEIGSTLTKLFKEIEVETPISVKGEDDLTNLWLQHPEIGNKRIEQIVGATTASTGLLVMNGQVIAGSGTADDRAINNVISFLNRYWRDGENSELVRFLKMEGDTNDYLIYASKLISTVVLTLIYPSNTSIQKIRAEVSQVKKEFQQVYPNTGVLRSELAGETESVMEKPPTILEPAVVPFIALEEEALPIPVISDSDEPEPIDDIGNILSEAELKNLDDLLANMPPPDPIMTDEDTSVEPLPVSELEPAEWIGEPEVDQGAPELAGQESPDTVEPVLDNADFAELFADKVLTDDQAVPVSEIAEREVEIPAVEQIEPVAQELDLEVEIPSAEEPGPVDEMIETIEEAAPAATFSQILSALDIEEPDIEELPVIEMPSDELQHPPLEAVEEQAVQVDLNMDEVIPESSDLPDFDFQLPWETSTFTTPEVSPETDLPISESEIETTAITEDILPLDTPATEQPEVVPIDEFEVPAEVAPVAAVFAVRKEPGTTPLGLKGFRFNYSCLLIPRDPRQFLARDLSERLSFILPQLHLAEGWRLTGISVRPLYMLWSLSAPLNASPLEIIKEIRSKTTAHIYANFPDIAEKNQMNDFWHANFMAVSGFDPPSVHLIQDFISLARNNQE